MNSQDNGLTLEGLAQRLEALERENAELRSKVATLEGSAKSRDEEEPLVESERQVVSRRDLLSKAGAAAAGLVIAGTLTQRDIREAKADPIVFTTNTADHGAVEGYNSNSSGYGVWGDSAGVGVYGTGQVGVSAESSNTLGYGIVARNTGGGTGLFASTTSSTNNYGLWAINNGTGAGVYGENTNTGGGNGVYGKGKNGVFGEGSETGVVGKGKNGVYGESSTPDGWGGVVGRNNASAGIGTYGEGTNGIGVQGIGKNGVHGKATGGYGGLFEGSKAQLRLVPNGTSGPPPGAHTKGEIYMDKAGTLYVCVASSTSTAAAKWKKVSATAV